MGFQSLHRSRGMLFAGSAFLVLGLLQGCGGSSPHSSSRSSAPALSGDTGLHSNGGTNPNAPFAVMEHSPKLMPRPSPTGDDQAPPCAASGLGIAEVAANVNGRYRVVRLAFVNRGETPCHLSGYPAVSLISDDGAPVGSLAIERTTAQSLTAVMTPGATEAPISAPSPSILLPAAGRAYFQLGWVTADNCPAVSRIVVSAPGTTRSFTLNHPLEICDARMRVTAVSQDEDGRN